MYTCPMHPDVCQTGPGACPKCGVTLESVMPSTPERLKTEWICPMHPEIVRDRPSRVMELRGCVCCRVSFDRRKKTAICNVIIGPQTVVVF